MTIESVNSHRSGPDHRGEAPRTEFLFGADGIHVELLDWPSEHRVAKAVASMVEATWSDRDGVTFFTDVEDALPIFEQALQGKTLPAVLEIPKFTFVISGVTRAVTHELVRHREAGFGQQSQRCGDMRHMSVRVPKTVELLGPEMVRRFKDSAELAKTVYCHMVDNGIHVQDARYVLPEGICTNIVATFPYNTLQRALSSRMCTAMLPEMVVTARAMRDRVREKCPLMGKYLQIVCERSGKCTMSDNLCPPCQNPVAREYDQKDYRYTREQNGAEYLLGQFPEPKGAP